MTDGHRLIFRDVAMRHYALGRARSVLPQFAPVPITTLLWIVAAMLISLGVLAWLIHIPVYASGLGVVNESLPPGAAEAGEVRRMAVLLSDKERSKVRVGQKVFWSFDDRGGRVRCNLNAIETQVSSPAEIYERFKLTEAAAAAITHPVVVAFVNLPPDNLPASVYAGNVYRIDVEVGRTRAISMLPFMSRFSFE